MKTHLTYLAILMAVSPCVNSLFAQTKPKPNIIFILSDDIGFDVPTVNGGQSFSTPFIN